MDLSIRTTEVSDEDRRWLASLHGFGETQSITLDGDEFSAFTDGVVPSGTVLLELGSGLYGPYTGDGDAAGLLLTTLHGVGAGKTVSGALFYRGRVEIVHLPEDSGLDAGAIADLTLIRFEGEVS